MTGRVRAGREASRRLPGRATVAAGASGLVLLGVLAAQPAVAATPRTIRASVSTAGAQAHNPSYFPAISGDGRYVAFQSQASNLVAGDTNATSDVFERDAVAGTTRRVSVSSSEAQANDVSVSAAISGNGRYVAYLSTATNLVAGDTNAQTDVFVRDLVGGTTKRVNVSSTEAQANSGSFEVPAISADGRYVAFLSTATNLVAGDTNNEADVFLRDTVAGLTLRVNLSSTGAQADIGGVAVAISADGQHVGFVSSASNLVTGDTNGTYDVFVRDVAAGQTQRVSLSSTGAQSPPLSDSNFGVSLSADGRYVAFDSTAALVPEDTNGIMDVFLRDTSAGQTLRVSVDSAGVEGNGRSIEPAISGDGQRVAFTSYATNLRPADTNGVSDVFVRFIATGQTQRASSSSIGAQGKLASASPDISADGRYVAFNSRAYNLVPGDTNHTDDVFRRDMLP